MSADKPDSSAIATCAALGSVVAGGVIGLSYAVSLADYTETLAHAAAATVGLLLASAIFAALVGTPIGFAIGLIVTRFLGSSMAHAALTGALTGATYPLFFLVTLFGMSAHGMSELASTFAALTVLGAMCGALAHWKVIGRAGEP